MHRALYLGPLLFNAWTAYGAPSSCDLSVSTLQKQLSAATDAAAAANAADHDRIAVMLHAFAGIWVDDGGAALRLARDCTIMIRVSETPPALTRGIFCPDGLLQTDTAPVLRMTTEESRFAASFQFTTQLGSSQSSCGSAEHSRFAGLTPLSFDIKTAAGGEAATFAYTKLGGEELILHNGAALDELNRSKDCPTLIKLAGDAGDGPNDKLLKQAAMLCQSEQQRVGCQR